MRLADGFVSRHHPDAVLEFKGKDKDPGLYEDLPESALRFLGRPMSVSYTHLTLPTILLV